MTDIAEKLMGRLRKSRGTRCSASSYSQYGEDMVLKAIFARYPENHAGFFVDVGAHHPWRLSNTYYFYRKGWRGINVDPVPGGAQLFRRYRHRDVYVPAGVSDARAELTYYIYDCAPLNTFSEEVVRSREQRPLRTAKVVTVPLSDILSKHLPANCGIDFLSIDVEGFEVPVLRSNDWNRFRPKVVVYEVLALESFSSIPTLESCTLLVGNGYQAICRTPSALFFVDSRSEVYDGSAFIRYIGTSQKEGSV